MPVPRIGWVVLAIVAVLSAMGWAHSLDSQNGSAPAASETGMTLQKTADDNRPSKSQVNEDGPDLEVKELRFDELETRLRTMEPGPERDYFAGMLANATGRFAESIRLLNSVLPAIRTSHPDRAAVALEDLADDYTKSFQYADAVRADEELLAHFSSQLKPEELQGAKNDVGDAKIARGTCADNRMERTHHPEDGTQSHELAERGTDGEWNASTVAAGYGKLTFRW
jgi:hypothetical protein